MSGSNFVNSLVCCLDFAHSSSFDFQYLLKRKGVPLVFPVNKERFSVLVPPAGKTMHNAFSVISEVMLGVVG